MNSKLIIILIFLISIIVGTVGYFVGYRTGEEWFKQATTRREVEYYIAKGKVIDKVDDGYVINITLDIDSLPSINFRAYYKTNQTFNIGDEVCTVYEMNWKTMRLRLIYVSHDLGDAINYIEERMSENE